MLLCFFLFFYSPTGKLSNKTLSTLSTPSNSLSQTLTSLSHCPRPDLILNITSPSKLDVTNPPADPFHQTSKPTQAPSRRSTPQNHAFDPPLIHTSDPSRPSLMLSTLSNSLSQTLSNSHLWTLTSLSRRWSTPPTQLAFRWVVSIFFIYMLRIFDLGNWNDKFIIFVESNDKSLRIGMYWKFHVCRNLCFYF